MLYPIELLVHLAKPVDFTPATQGSQTAKEIGWQQVHQFSISKAN
jgi:hypothetical protein